MKLELEKRTEPCTKPGEVPLPQIHQCHRPKCQAHALVPGSGGSHDPTARCGDNAARLSASPEPPRSSAARRAPYRAAALEKIFAPAAAVADPPGHMNSESEHKARSRKGEDGSGDANRRTDGWIGRNLSHQ